MRVGNQVKGQQAPPPLPMYRPVVLKHVPTMVRRRYERFDADKLELQVDSNEDVKSAGDGAVDADVPHPAFSVNSDVEDEAPDNGEEYFNNELGLYEIEDNRLQDANRTHGVDTVAFTVEWDAEALKEDAVSETIQLSDSPAENITSEDDVAAVSDHASGVDNTEAQDEGAIDSLSKHDSPVHNLAREDSAIAVADQSSNGVNTEEQDEGTIDSGSEHGNVKYRYEGASYANGAWHASVGDQVEYKEERDSEDELGIIGAWHARVGDRTEYSRGGSENALEREVTTPENKAKRLHRVHTPPPLPMYKPVVLKHVPTMLRRRYERFDADKIKPHIDNEDLHELEVGIHENENLTSEVSIGQGDSIDGYHMDVDTREDDESEISQHADSLTEEIITSEGKVEVDTNSGDEVQDRGIMYSSTEHESLTEEIITSEGKVDMDSNSGDEVQDREIIFSGTQHGHSKSGNYGVNYENAAFWDIEDKVQDNRDGESSNECDSSSETSTRKDMIVDLNIKDEGRDKGNIDCGYERGHIQCKDNDGKHENASEDFVEAIMDKGEGHSDHEQGWPPRSSKTEGKGAEDTTPCDEDPCLENETEEYGHLNFNNKQGTELQSEEFADNSLPSEGWPSRGSKSEVNAVEDTSPACDRDAILENETEKYGRLKFDYKQDTELYCEEFADNSLPSKGLLLDDSEREHHVSEVMNCANHMDDSVKNEVQDKAHQFLDDEQDLQPEAIKKTSDQDGYDLCCPICNHCITRTIVFRRRENSQPQRTTCLSFLIALCGN